MFLPTPVRKHVTRGIDVDAWHMGTIMLGRFSGPELFFDRTPQLIASSGLDHLLVQLYVEGGFSGVAGVRSIDVSPGDICVFDLTDTLATRTTDFTNYSLLIPRDAINAVIDDLTTLHGMVIAATQPLGAILGEYIVSLARRLPTLSVDQALLAGRATVSLTGSVLLSEMHRQGRVPSTPGCQSPIRRISAYIDAHIGDPGLDAHRIARDLGLSRASLYRLLAPAGGVARYIRRRRLSGAALELADLTRSHRIGGIARRWGFATDASFARAFRQAFGIAPRAAREQGLAFLQDVDAASEVDERVFAGWLRMLHGDQRDGRHVS